MQINELKNLFSKFSNIESTIDALQYKDVRIKWSGLVGSSDAFLAANIKKSVPGHHLYILQDKESAAYFLNDLQAITQNDKSIVFYPASYRTPYSSEQTDNANIVARSEALEKLNRENNLSIVTYPKALIEKVPTKKKLISNTFKLEVGKDYNLDELNEKLLSFEFQPVDFVYEPGQFAIRGGILDIFSYVNDNPFRIEFFDEEVESIRTFDPVSQLSINNHQFLTVIPNVHKKLIQEENGSILEFLGIHTTVWLSSYSILIDKLKKEYLLAEKNFDKLDKDSPVKHDIPSQLFLHFSEFEKQTEQFNIIEWGPDYKMKATHEFEFNFKPQPAFNKNFQLLADDLNSNKKTGFKNLIFSNQPKQIERLLSIFKDMDINVDFTPIHHALKEGFISEDLKIACYTDHQIFERYHRFRLKEGFRETKQALTLKEVYNLQKGDYVTHIDHGVGQFSGLETIDVNGKPQEAIRLIYKDNDVLYVSIHSLHRISKYSGKEGKVPSMNKLGTKAWSNLKRKTKKKIKEVAFDLIQLYAKRKAKNGFAFSQDTYLQNELEASFIYEDTPDQLKATEAVKEDMEKDTPMDRLICGDVGFGKTEIAIRAAFKAAVDGKQVAVLVPTTILSLQHFRSFKERLSNFPVTVDYINRFKSAKQVTETKKKLADGKIDILVGTHKIVGKGIKFKDLGLIIIDEEQKFGVGVKDKLKTLKETVDTLTLTATPIPRTLQFSLMGARDLSVINTPPPNRQPVLTEITEFNEEKIRDAIAYEVSRNGQVYFVHNRLENIKEVSGMIQRLCPGIRVAIGHGQMEGKQLEKIMMDFINHEYDVLLATTIIESGIDISNANTIIINNANNFGLSDLHQLRGRVGRSNKKGFCYLIAPRYNMLTADARKRLNALVQFSDLGAGFNIAMKDLDIRGAGNLLGAEQSGFIADIGFDMYQKILNEAIEELRNEEFKSLFEEANSDQLMKPVDDCIFETDLELRIPDDYVNSVAERLALYRELDDIPNEEQLEKFKVKLIDRFGKLPETVETLLNTLRIRWKSQEIGFQKIILKSSKMIGHFIADSEHPYFQGPVFTKVLNYIQTNPNNVKMSEKNDKLRLVFSDVNSIEMALSKLNEVIN